MSYPIEIIRNVGRPTNYSKALEWYALQVAQWVQQYMRDNDRIATGDSIGSFEILLIDNEVFLSAAESVGFALQGRKAGKFPNITDIAIWIEAKPIIPYPDPVTGKIPTFDQLVYLISKKISERGTDPPKLLPQNISLVITSIGQKYMERLGEEQAFEIMEDFKQTFNRKRGYKAL